MIVSASACSRCPRSRGPSAVGNSGQQRAAAGAGASNLGSGATVVVVPSGGNRAPVAPRALQELRLRRPAVPRLRVFSNWLSVPYQRTPLKMGART